jgi:hypothetical protein
MNDAIWMSADALIHILNSQVHIHIGDLISLLLFVQNKESRLTSPKYLLCSLNRRKE